MLENENDDPRQDAIPFDIPFFSNSIPETAPQRDEGDDRPPAGAGGIFDMISTMLQPSTTVGGFGGRGTMPSGGYTMVFGGPGGTRTVRVEGQTVREGAGGEGNGNQGGRIPTFFEFLANAEPQANGGAGNDDPQRSPASLLATYILSSLLRNQNGDLPAGMIDPFNGAGGRMGDYVLNEEALQALLTELMATGGAPPEPPTPQNLIDELPRVVFEDDNPILNETCSICHEPFNPALAASPDADANTSTPSPSSSKTESASQRSDSQSSNQPVEQLGITLPCKHTFHEDCILPWLRMKSTCPVCRMSLLPQTDSSRQNEEPPPIPGGWDNLD